jgi:uncharacterized protein (DUF302 family)
MHGPEVISEQLGHCFTLAALRPGDNVLADLLLGRGILVGHGLSHLHPTHAERKVSRQSIAVPWTFPRRFRAAGPKEIAMTESNRPLHRTLALNFSDALERVPAALKDKGFGVLTTIDVAATLKAKLGVDVPSYTILGACNPKMAHQALTLDPTIGVFLPCNVIVRQVEGGVEVRAVDPLESIGARESLRDVAQQVRGMLADVIASV